MPEVIQVIKIVKVTEIIEVEERVEKEYDLTWVYVACGVSTPIGTFLIISLCYKCRTQRKIHSEALMDRRGESLRNMIFVKRKIVRRKIVDVISQQSSESEETVRQMID